jgi:hypothetical protein
MWAGALDVSSQSERTACLAEASEGGTGAFSSVSSPEAPEAFVRMSPRGAGCRGCGRTEVRLYGSGGGTRFFVACSNAYAIAMSRGSLQARPVKLTP